MFGAYVPLITGPTTGLNLTSGQAGQEQQFQEAVKAGFLPNTDAGRVAFDVYTSQPWPTGPLKQYGLEDFAGFIQAAEFAIDMINPAQLSDPTLTTAEQVRARWEERLQGFKLYGDRYGVTPEEADRFIDAINKWVPYWTQWWLTNANSSLDARQRQAGAPPQSGQPIASPVIPTISTPPAIQLFAVAYPDAHPSDGGWVADRTGLAAYAAIRRIVFGMDGRGLTQTPTPWTALPRIFVVRYPANLALHGDSDPAPTAPGYPDVYEWRADAGARAGEDRVTEASLAAAGGNLTDLSTTRVMADEAALWNYLRGLPNPPRIQRPANWGARLPEPFDILPPDVVHPTAVTPPELIDDGGPGSSSGSTGAGPTFTTTHEADGGPSLLDELRRLFQGFNPAPAPTTPVTTTPPIIVVQQPSGGSGPMYPPSYPLPGGPITSTAAPAAAGPSPWLLAGLGVVGLGVVVALTRGGRRGR